jgi:hypothetical protein
VQREPEQAEVPPDADGAGSELAPRVVIDRRPVFEVQAGARASRLLLEGTVSQLIPSPNSHVAAKCVGGSHAVIVPPALPSSWYRPPRRRSPVTGRNQRGMRSAVVTASHRSSMEVGYQRTAFATRTGWSSRSSVHTLRSTAPM